jgi:transposase
MTSKAGTKLLTELLALERVKVIAHSQYESLGIILHLEAGQKESICPRCGRKSLRLHQNHRYLVKDLPLSGQPVYLEVNRRQFKCDSCRKPFSEELDFVKRGRHYTKRLAVEIVGQVLENDIQSVAKRSYVSSEEIERSRRRSASGQC